MKRLVWRYERGWVSQDETGKEQLSANRVQDYYRELSSVHDMRSLRGLQDRVRVDTCMSPSDKARFDNSIMSAWKTVVCGQKPRQT